MMICGGAVMPVLQGIVADTIGIQQSYFVPIICFAYLVFFGIRVQGVLKSQGLDFDNAVVKGGKGGH